MTAASYCRNQVIRARSSFFLSLLFLSPARRRAMFAIYAYCRQVDDIVDQPGRDEVAAMAQLDTWRQEIHALFDGRASHPLAEALAEAVQRFQLPKAPFLELLEGMVMDLRGQRYEQLEDLSLYCQRVAVTVGQLSVRVFGLSGEEGEGFAHHLGMAFQLTNILRDLAEDARMGRIYLPLAWLREEGAEAEDLLAGRWNPALARVAERLATLADRHYRQAWTAVSREHRRQLLAAWIMAEVYHAYLEQLQRVGFNVFGHRVAVSRWAKLGLLWQGWLRRCNRPPTW